MKDILISIIIPVYNLEKYIAETINSCLMQDIPYDEYEIICVDDGSKDKSAEIIREFQSRYPNIILHSQTNSGVSAARNKGLEIASGRYVWFLDGDDMMLPNCLKLITETMTKTCADSFWFKCNHFTTEPEFVVPTGRHESCSTYENLIPFMEYNGGAGVCGNVYKTEFLKENALYFNSKIKYSEDVLYNFKVLLKLRVAAKTTDIFYIRRDNPESVIHTTKNNLDKHMESMLLLAKEYDALATQQEIDSRRNLCVFKRNLAVRALLFGCFKTGKFALAKEKIKILKELGFYSYPLMWSTLKGNRSTRDFLINYISFLFPCKVYFYFCVLCMQLFRFISRRKL